VSQIGTELVEKGRRVVIIQLMMTLVVAVAFFVYGISHNAGQGAGQGLWDALSAAYGGLTSVLLALLSIRGFKRANAIALSDPKKSMTILYVGAVQRFVTVLVLLGIALGAFKLAPIAVFIGFALTQASYLMGVRDRKAARNPDKKL
jgi:ATP synthase protein I